MIRWLPLPRDVRRRNRDALVCIAATAALAALIAYAIYDLSRPLH